ncbi:MAG: hypothetical protein IV086_02495 [Hyphomonadaceae bacterium]|nr:hypothetical protein [Hyphomonadaceae bacterium]
MNEILLQIVGFFSSGGEGRVKSLGIIILGVTVSLIAVMLLLTGKSGSKDDHRISPRLRRTSDEQTVLHSETIAPAEIDPTTLTERELAAQELGVEIAKIRQF